MADNQNLVPRGTMAGVVRPFEFVVRTLADYDVSFMQDRIRSEIFVNGKPAGVYAVARVDEDMFGQDPASLQEAVEFYGPDLERMVIDEFMGLGYRGRVRELEHELGALKAYINRPRWWQFRPVRREWKIFRRRMASIFDPGE